VLNALDWREEKLRQLYPFLFSIINDLLHKGLKLYYSCIILGNWCY
jgi:hypothetical protein